MGHFFIVVQPHEETLSVLTVPALYMAGGNKVWQLHGTNDWITLSHCQGVILTLNKGKKRGSVCVCVSVG